VAVVGARHAVPSGRSADYEIREYPRLRLIICAPDLEKDRLERKALPIKIAKTAGKTPALLRPNRKRELAAAGEPSQQGWARC